MKLYQSRDIAGKTALITGASAGIGRACALLLAEQGCSLVLVARRLEKLNEVREEVLSLFPTASVRVEACDIGVDAEIQELASRLENLTIDILVNNAGLVLGLDAGDQGTTEDTHTMFNTNVLGLIAMTKAFAGPMRQRNVGDIVNIGSVAGSDHYGGGAVYCATKSAVDAYTNCLRMDLVDTDIRVICISPGLVCGTEFSVVRFKGDMAKSKAPYVGLDCLTAMDVADQVVYSITRPSNVQVAQLKSYCNQQGHARFCFSRK